MQTTLWELVIIKPMRAFAALLFFSGMLRAADPFAGSWDMDIAKSRIGGPEGLKRVELTFTERDGGLEYANAAYRVDGSVRNSTVLVVADDMEHPNPTTPGAKYIARRLDATKLERVIRLNDKVIMIVIDALLPDGKSLLQFVQSFNPDGSLKGDETQIFRRR
jgi:hypothetical protein